MGPCDLPIRGTEHPRDPHVTLVHDSERSRQHADHRHRAAIEIETAADHGSVRLEPVSPEAIANQDRRATMSEELRPMRLVVVRESKESAQFGPDTHSRKPSVCHQCSGEVSWGRRVVQRDAHGVQFAARGTEDMRSCQERSKISRADRHRSAFGMTLHHHDQSVGVRKWQPTKDDGIGHAEDERAASNAEPQTKRREGGGSLEAANGDPKILPKCIHRELPHGP